jgi:hypothetical protein
MSVPPSAAHASGAGPQPQIQRLLEDALADEDLRLEALEQRVSELQARRRARAEAAPPAVEADEPEDEPEGVEADEGGVDTVGLEEARRLVRESGQFLRQLQEQIDRLESEQTVGDREPGSSPAPEQEESPSGYGDYEQEAEEYAEPPRAARALRQPRPAPPPIDEQEAAYSDDYEDSPPRSQRALRQPRREPPPPLEEYEDYDDYEEPRPDTLPLAERGRRPPRRPAPPPQVEEETPPLAERGRRPAIARDQDALEEDDHDPQPATPLRDRGRRPPPPPRDETAHEARAQRPSKRAAPETSLYDWEEEPEDEPPARPAPRRRESSKPTGRPAPAREESARFALDRAFVKDTEPASDPTWAQVLLSNQDRILASLDRIELREQELVRVIDRLSSLSAGAVGEGEATAMAWKARAEAAERAKNEARKELESQTAALARLEQADRERQAQLEATQREARLAQLEELRRDERLEREELERSRAVSRSQAVRREPTPTSQLLELLREDSGAQARPSTSTRRPEPRAADPLEESRAADRRVLAALKAQLLSMGSEHQALVHAHGRLVERMVQLFEDLGR